MTMEFKEILEELSNKIPEVYDLELAQEMTAIYNDLLACTKNISKKYWNLLKMLATIEKERDELRNKLNKQANGERRGAKQHMD